VYRAAVISSGSTLVLRTPSQLLVELLQSIKHVICVDEEGNERKLDVVSVEYRGKKVYILVKQRKVKCREIKLPLRIEVLPLEKLLVTTGD